MKKVLGVLGENGAGKDTLCNFFKKHLPSVEVLKFSYPLSEALEVFLDRVARDDQQWLAQNLRERYGKDIIAKGVEKRVDQSEKKIVLLNGVRVWDDYLLLKRNEGTLIYITAKKETRWKRLRERGEKKDDRVSFEEFLKKEDYPTEREIPKIGKEAHFFIENKGSFDDLEEEVLKIIKKINEEG